MGKCKGGIGSGILQNRISAVSYIFFNSQSTHSIITSLQSVICVFLLTVLLGFSVFSVIWFGAVIYSVSCLCLYILCHTSMKWLAWHCLPCPLLAIDRQYLTTSPLANMSLKVALSELSPPSPLDGHLFLASHLFCFWRPEDYD